MSWINLKVACAAMGSKIYVIFILFIISCFAGCSFDSSDYSEIFTEIINESNLEHDEIDIEHELKKLNMILELESDNADLYYNRGWIYGYMGKIDKAKMDYTMANELDDEHADALFNRGTLFFREKEYEKAIEDFSRTIELNPEFSDALCNRGNAYFMLGRTELALNDYNEALRINSADPDIYYNRAALYLALGQKSLADADLKKAASLGHETAEDYIR